MLYIDGFDLGDYTKRWTTLHDGPGITTSTRFGTGKALNLAWQGRLLRGFAAVPELYVGMAVKPVAATYGRLLAVYTDGATQNHVEIWSSSATTYTVTVPGIGTLASFSALTQGVWSYLEARFVIHNTSGRVVVKVNGVTVVDFTGDTRAAGSSTGIDALLLGSEGSGYASCQSYIDDLWINDTGFLGDKRVQTLTPNGAGSSTQWTPTAGTNYECAADADDATYVASSTAGQRDLYTLTNLVANTVVVDAVQTVAHAYKSDAGSVFAKSVVKSGASVGSGASIALPASVSGFTDTFATDPSTGAAWTVAAVNSLEAGVEVI